ncbi:Hint domain-containing protein [uncultured Tateyamaria sp.]|uniref:Hint domain-containing protein n=1 Tax=uncultured Tateyamaria sp. TaxID=455651 RepID=UPI0026360276|nr:Hint domain-containing protein [uncultured Tateyamaria sp.]
MPNGGSITGFLFSDFTFVNDNNQLNPGQNGPFSLPGNAQATLAFGAQTIDINVDDDDPEFDDGFQDDPGGTPLNQTLRDDIDTTNAAGDPVTVGAGAVLEIEFTLTAVPVGGGPPIDLLFVAAGPGENQGDLTLVVSTAPLVPGATYNISFANDGGGTPYGQLVCFVRGTLIRTPGGDVPVETLQPGDRVITMDEGAQPIIFTSHRAVLFPGQVDRPITIAPHSFGPDKPYARTQVSPRHCLLHVSSRFRLLFDTAQVFITAQDSVDGTNITRDTTAMAVEYHHIMLSRHAVIWANGMACESYFPGKVARASLDPIARARLVALYPELSDPNAPAPFARARRCVRGYEGQLAQPAGLPEAAALSSPSAWNQRGRSSGSRTRLR